MGVSIFAGMKVRPASNEKVDEAPERPDIKTLSVLSSPVNVSEPLRTK
jgi:hypothetical protein